MSVCKSMLGLEGSERGSIIGYLASPSTCTSISKSTSNQKLSDSDENGQASSVYKTQSAGPRLQDEDEDEAGVCGTWEWKEIEFVEQNEERWLKSQEEIMEEEADEVGMGGGG